LLKIFKIKVIIEDPICSDYGDFELAFYGSFLPVPNIDSFKDKLNELKNLDESIKSIKNDNNEFYPGRIIPYKVPSVNSNLDEGEIDDVHIVDEIKNSNSQNINNDDLIRINVERGEPILLSVTNTSNHVVKVTTTQLFLF
jgi:hypothetical protein